MVKSLGLNQYRVSKRGDRRVGLHGEVEAQLLAIWLHKQQSCFPQHNPIAVHKLFRLVRLQV